MKKERYEFLDHMKGVAVIWMILFHFCFDLIYFGFINRLVKKEFYWIIQPKIIISIFLFCVGMSLCISHGKKVKWNRLLKRSFKLAILAIFVSVATYFIFPRNWVYFGILHNILFSSVLALPFLKKPKISLFLGLTLIIPSALFKYEYPFIKLSNDPVDHVAFFPWFGFVLIGVFLYSKNVHLIKVPEYKFKRVVNFLGKYSLEIYMTHQIILFPLTYLLYKATN